MYRRVPLLHDPRLFNRQHRSAGTVPDLARPEPVAMAPHNTLLKASLVAGSITPIGDTLLQVEFGQCSSSLMAQAPPVVWKGIMPAPSRPSFGAYYTWNGSSDLLGDPAAGGALVREEEDEDPRYDICELKDASGNLIGYAAAGYNALPNWGCIDDPWVAVLHCPKNPLPWGSRPTNIAKGICAVGWRSMNSMAPWPGAGLVCQGCSMA